MIRLIAILSLITQAQVPPTLEQSPSILLDKFCRVAHCMACAARHQFSPRSPNELTLPFSLRLS